MINDIFLIVVEWDNFYDTKEYWSYAFENINDAKSYMSDLIESFKLDFIERFDCESEDQLLNEYLEITDYQHDCVNMYIEDDCNVSICIEQKPILKY